MRFTALVCLAFIATAYAGPVNYWLSGSDSSCAAKCSGSSSSKFRYQRDTTYFYDYSVSTPFPLPNQANSLTITARAEIQVLDDCEFVLRLKDTRMVQLEETRSYKYPEKLSEFQRSLEANMLRFSFDDGRIETVCPESGEGTWALNFKRGLLTAFQNSMESGLDKDQTVTEVDVTGECEAQYTSGKTWGWNGDISLSKFKDLTACSQRDGYRGIIQSVQYKVISEIQSTPILKSPQNCRYTIDSSTRILKSAICEETHIFQPFSSQIGGSIKLIQELTFKGQKSGVDSGIATVSDHRSLLFEHSSDSRKTENSREVAEQIVKEICHQTREDIRPETPRAFSELVDVVKALSVYQLQSLHSQLKNKVLCPNNEKAIKFFYDTLPLAGSTGAVQMMSSLIRGADVDSTVAGRWLSSLAFIKEPSREMVKEATDLIQNSLSKDDALLPVTAMARRYVQRQQGPEEDKEVKELAEALKFLIPRYCSPDQKDIKHVLRALKAIGNLGTSSLLADTLDMCLTSSYAPLEVQIAAAEAYRRMPCDKSRQQLWNQLNNNDQDVEVRIASYLSIMRCPDDDTLDKVINLLQKEEDEQLGAFIYSHLKNIKETSDPLKQDLAKAVSRLYLKDFDLNALKHSRNYEASILLNKINVGFTADSDVIYSPRSPLPRSARANLTVDLFGRSVNVFEIGGRAEGLEYLLERVLGPIGLFPSGDKKDSKTLSEVKATTYARIFGNDVAFSHMDGLDEIPKKMKLPKFLDSLVDGKSVSWTKSLQIMDGELIVPTVAGLPLRLSLNGSTTLNLEADGKVDLRQATASPRSLEISGFFKPSAAMEITGTFVIDASVTKTGLRLRNTIHSSSGISGRIELNRGSNLNIEIDPPKDKMEIFNTNSEFFILTDEGEEKMPVEGNSQQKTYTYCSGETASHVTGIKLCGQFEYPVASRSADAPFSPMAGPTKFSLVSYRTDSHSTYKLFIKTLKTKKKSMAQFLMGTPGSKVDRFISTDVTITHSDDKKFQLTFVSPWKKLSIDSNFVSNKEIFSSSNNVLVDEKDRYGLTTELKMSKSKGQATYVPFVEITEKGKTTTLVSGQVEVSLPETVDVNLELQAPSSKPYNIKTIYMNKKFQKRITLSLDQQGKDQYLFDSGTMMTKSGKNINFRPELTVKTPKKELLSISGSGDFKPERSLSGDIAVNVYKMKPASVNLVAKKMSKGKNQKKYDIDLKIKSHLLSSTLSTNYYIRGNKKTSNIKVSFSIPKVGKDTVSLNTKINDKSNKGFTKYIISSNLESAKYPDYNTGMDINIEHKNRLSSADVEIQYGSNPKDKTKVINLSTSLSRNFKDINNVDVDLKLKASNPQKDFNYDVVIGHFHAPKKLKSSVEVKLHPLLKNDFEASVALTDKTKKLMKMTGDFSLAAMGRRLALHNIVYQSSPNQYAHSLDIICSKTGKHSIDSIYTDLGKNKHKVVSNINFKGEKPIKFQASTNLNPPKNLEVEASVVHGKDLYSAEVQSKILQEKAGKWKLNLRHPDGEVSASVEGRKTKDKYDGQMMLDWAAGKKNRKKQISVEGSLRHQNDKDLQFVKGDLSVKTPFKEVGNFGGDVDFSKKSNQYTSTSELYWGKKKISSTMTAKRPLSLERAEISVTAQTPFKNMKEIELELDHESGPKMSTFLRSKLEDKEAEILLKGEDNSNTYERDLSGSMNIKSSFKNLKNTNVVLRHKSNGRDLTSSWTMNHGGKNYLVKLTGTDENGKTVTKRHGKLEIKTPQHGKIFVTADHLQKSDKFSYEVSVVHNREQKGLWKLVMGKGYKSGDVEFHLKHPEMEDIKAKGEVSYAKHPMTVSSFVQWAPRSRITFDGSLNAASRDSFDLNSKLTTPFDKHENMVLKASRRLEGKEYISHANLDYGVRKSVDIENRFRFDDNVQMIRTTVESPCPWLRSFNSGFSLQRSRGQVSADADFEMLPYVEKYDGFIVLKSNDDHMDGKLRINTPHKKLQSVQMVALCKAKGKSGREASLEFELVPHGVYRFDGSVKSDSPYHLDASVTTPFPQAQDLGVSLMLNPHPKKTDAHLKLQYQPDQEIDAEFKLSLEGNVDGSFILKTPFSGYEDNNVIVRHDSSKRGFTSHGEARLGQENVQADVSFNKGRITSGSLKVTNSFVDGLKKITGDFKLRGKLDNLRGDASVNIGKQSASTVFSRVIKDKSAKSSFSLTTPMTKDLKMSFSHQDSSTADVIAFNSNFDGHYGDESTEGDITVSYGGLKDTSFEVSFKPATKGVKPFSVSFDHKMSEDMNYDKGSIRSDIEAIGDVDFSYTRTGPLGSMNAKIKVDQDTKSLIDLEIETQNRNDEIHGKVTSNGKLLPTLVAAMDHKGKLSDFNTKTMLSSRRGVVFKNDFTFVVDGPKLELDGKVVYNLLGEQRTHSIELRKFGTMQQFNIDLSEQTNGREVKASLRFDSVDKITVVASVENLLEDREYIGAEFEHSGDVKKFLTTAKIYLNKNEVIDGRMNFYMYEMERVEAKFELATPFEGYKMSSVEYRHENNHPKHTSFFQGKLGDSEPVTVDIAIQMEGERSLDFSLQAPFEQVRNIKFSSLENDDVIRVTLDLGQGEEYKFSYLRYVSLYPTEPQLEIITPFRTFKKLTAYVRKDASGKGPVTTDIVMHANGHTVSHKGEMEIVSPRKVSLSMEVTSDTELVKQSKVVVNFDAEKDHELTGNLDVHHNDELKVHLSGRLFNKVTSWRNDRETQFELDGQIPCVDIRTFSTSLDHSYQPKKVTSKMQLQVNEEKLLDGDITYVDNNKRELTINVREPRPMELLTAFKEDEYNKEEEIYLNWNRDDPSSNIRIQGTEMVKPGYYSNERTSTLTIIRPSRTMGAEYSITSSTGKVEATGKLIWDKLRQGEVSFALDLTDNSRKGQKSYEGLFKVIYPTRTVGISGLLSSTGASKRAHATFSWDIDRDESKRIGINAGFSGNEYTKADVVLNLPADVEVATEMIMNQGNTLFDGKTDITYSRDSRKTLTVYSKVKNNPPPQSGYFSSQDRGFNLSMEVGVTHPDTRLDVQLDYHLARSQEAMTSSLGLHYLTDRRAVKNLALFAEIDNLKRQINLVASGPSRNLAVTGKLVREEPLSMTVSIFDDGEEKLVSSVDVKDNDFTFEIGEPGKPVSLRAFYPNSSSLVMQLKKPEGKMFYRTRFTDDTQAALSVSMVTPELLRSRISWKPSMLEELRESLLDQIELLRLNSRDVILDLNRDVQTEVVAKYQTITSAVVEDSQPFVEFFINELEILASTIGEAMEKLEEAIKDNEFHLNDLREVYEKNSPGVFTTSNLRKLRNIIRKSSQEMKEAFNAQLENLQNFPISDVYAEVVTQRVGQFVQAFDSQMASLIQGIKEQDLNVAERLRQAADNLRKSANIPDLETIKEKARKLRDMDVSELSDQLDQALEEGVRRFHEVHVPRLRQFRDSLQDYKVVQMTPDSIKEGLAEAVDFIFDHAQWVLSNWDVKQCVKDALRTYLQTMKEIIEVELVEMEDSMLTFSRNPVKVFDLEKGLIVIEVPVVKIPENVSLYSFVPSLRSRNVSNYGLSQQFPDKVIAEREMLYAKPYYSSSMLM